MKTIRYLLTLAAMLALARPASAAVPPAINYQGRLTNAAGVPQPGVRGMSVKIYDSATTGAPLYSEAVGNVTVDANGVYGFEFGLVGAGGSGTLGAALAGSIEQWLELEVDGIAQNPRQKILAVPFALMAGGLPDGAVSSSMITDGTLSIAKTSGLQSALDGKVPASELSTTGGAGKVAQWSANGTFRFGPVNAAGSVAPGPAVVMPAWKRLAWENASGVVVADEYLFEGHSGGHEVVRSAPRHCFYWDEGFQMGNANDARGGRYLYMRSNGNPDVGDPTRESVPVWLNGAHLSGGVSQMGIQWIPTGDHAGEMVFGISNGDSGYGNGGRIKSISGIVLPFSVTAAGPKIPSGKTLTFGDGSTLATAPNQQARTGNATLVAGTKAVAVAGVTDKTNVLLTRRSAGGAIGDLTYTTNIGTGITINSASATDTSRVTYLLIEDTVASNAPTISGTNAVGDTMTVFSGGGSSSWQWYSNGVPVSGRTTSTYVVRYQDLGLPITCREDGIASNVIIAWKPADEPGYFADYRADAGVLKTGAVAATNGESVETWQDQSSNGNHLTQATGANQPLLDTTTYSGFPHVNFDAMDDTLAKLIVIPRPHSVFIVAESKSSVANKRIFAAGPSGSRITLEQISPTDVRIDALQTAGSQMPLNTRHLVTCKTSSSATSLRVDSNGELTDSIGTTASGSAIMVSQSSAGGGADCRVYSLLIYTSNLDSAAQARVRSYLKAKWGTP